MTDKIYGNEFALKAFESMFKSGRLPHSFLIYGDKGLGKKTLAKYLAASILCEKGGGKPCGECRSCRNAKKGIHPDIIFPTQSGKLCTYTAEECRRICSDAFVAPNDGDFKIYIFSDADAIQITAQNVLLKIIEEPPQTVYFIFTASSKDVFLPTIISRVSSIGASSCNYDECSAALAVKGYDSGQIKEAMENFGGNIGMCMEYLENESLRGIAALTKSAADSIINGDEYSLLKVLSSAELRERSMALMFLEMLDKLVRDAVIQKFSEDSVALGCYPKGSLKLGEKISVKTADRIHRCIAEAASDVKANVNSGLLMSALCGEIMNS